MNKNYSLTHFFSLNTTTIKSQPSNVTQTERQWGIFAHLSAFAGYFIPFGNILGPLIIYFMKKEESQFIAEHAKASLNFQISLAIYTLVFYLFYVYAFFFKIFLQVPFMMLVLLLGPMLIYALIQLICVLRGVSAASDGKLRKYPLTIRFLR